MTIPPSAATPHQPVAPVTSANPKTTPAKASAAASDQVHLSSAALAALQEASETPAQTAKEARAGDHQAQRLLVRESHASTLAKA
jgi:hypothetical protein